MEEAHVGPQVMSKTSAKAQQNQLNQDVALTASCMETSAMEQDQNGNGKMPLNSAKGQAMQMQRSLVSLEKYQVANHGLQQ